MEAVCEHVSYSHIFHKATTLKDLCLLKLRDLANVHYYFNSFKASSIPNAVTLPKTLEIRKKTGPYPNQTFTNHFFCVFLGCFDYYYVPKRKQLTFLPSRTKFLNKHDEIALSSFEKEHFKLQLSKCTCNKYPYTHELAFRS